MPRPRYNCAGMQVPLRARKEAERLRPYPAGPAVVQLQGGKAVRPAEPAGEVKTKKYTG